MTLEEATFIVSYKLGLKRGNSAKKDAFLCSKTIDQAIADSANQCAREFEAKRYLKAHQMVKRHKQNCFEPENQ